MSKTKKEYSGPFLWLALFSFVIPIFVGVQAFQAIPQTVTYPEVRPDVSGVDQNLWDYLLRTYVAGGLIDYDGLKRDYLFKVYIKQLAESQPEKLETDLDRLAYLSNAYNAFVIHGVIVHKIKNSVLDLKQKGGTDFFDLTEHILAGETISLNELEHQRIRKQFHEPRIHVALVCAAKSCPQIRPEAYSGDRLEQQFEDQAKIFANRIDYVKYSAEEQKIYLSSIVDWYKEDFGGDSGVLSFLSERVNDPALQEGIKLALDGKVEIDYFPYDWSLNTQNANSNSGGNHSSFGSGSIPND